MITRAVYDTQSLVADDEERTCRPHIKQTEFIFCSLWKILAVSGCVFLGNSSFSVNFSFWDKKVVSDYHHVTYEAVS